MNLTKMKTSIDSQLLVAAISRVVFSGALALAFIFGLNLARADETCSSPSLARNEAHHGGFTDDRHQLWLAGLDNSRVFIFDVHTDPAKPRYVKTIDNFAETTGGAIGPHGAYALPGRMLVPCLSNAKDHGGRTALVEFGNDGNYIATHWLPTKDDAQGAVNADLADGYGYDARVLPRKNALLTSSFTGWNNYMTEFSK